MMAIWRRGEPERVDRKPCRTHNHAKADVFDYIERFYDPTRRHSTLGYLSPMGFERQAQVADLVSAKPAAARIGDAPLWL